MQKETKLFLSSSAAALRVLADRLAAERAAVKAEAAVAKDSANGR